MLRCISDTESGAPGCLCHRPEIRLLTRRLGGDLSRRGFVAGAAASVMSFKRAAAQAPTRIVFSNLRLFDGKTDELRDGLSVLVEGNRIKAVASGNPPPPDGARLVDCGGRVLMPGLIDAHWHMLFAALPLSVVLTAEASYIQLAAAAEAERTLMRGFTTIRDLGGPAFALKQAIDEGLVAGPRVYPSGAMITASGGHGDLRPLSDLPSDGRPSLTERTGGSSIADSPDSIRLRVREQLLQGASQIKVVGSGGVSSPRSPLDVASFTEPELRAAVEAAADWSTYVTVHAYTPNTIRRAIAAGAVCIEHGHLMDDATARLMADKGTWLSVQPFLSADDAAPMTGESQIKMRQVFAGTDRVYTLARNHKVKMAFGSDLLFSQTLTRRQGTMLTHLTRWFRPSEILKMATAANGELLALSGPRNPYPGRLGVVEDGALADLLLVDGNPLTNITLLETPEKSLVVIMKDGRIQKETLKA